MTNPIILLFVPLDEEMRYIHDHLERQGATFRDKYDPTRSKYHCTYKRRDRRDLDIFFRVLKDMGNTRTAAVVASELFSCGPDYAILIGLAGSLDGSRATLGDVVIANRVKLYYPDKIKTMDASREFFAPAAVAGDARIHIDPRDAFSGSSFFRYRRDAINWDRSTDKLQSYLSYLKSAHRLPLEGITQANTAGLSAHLENPIPKILYTSILGSDMVIDSAEYIAYMKEKNDSETSDYYFQKSGGKNSRCKWFISDIDAVDMESYGFFKALEAVREMHESVHGISVRGISDLANEKESLDNDTADKVRETCVRNATHVALDIIEFLFRPLH